MGDFPNHQVFSKDIAESIGLEEAIIFETIKSQEIKRISIKELIKFLSYIPETKIIRCLQKLKKLNLVELNNDFASLKIIKTRPVKTKSTRDNSSSFLREITFQAKQLGVKKKTIQSNLENLKKQLSSSKQKNIIRDGILKFLVAEQKKVNKLNYLPNLKKPIEKTWLPNMDAVSILKSAEVSEEFITNSIPEFILFWREKNFKSDSWNTLFVNHVRKEWAKFTNKINDKNKPKKMTSSWEPDPSCYDVLKLAQINTRFAVEQLAEFRIFWIDSNEIMTSWNSKFIQHVKYKWYKNNPEASGIISRLNDKEWAVDVEH